MHAHSYSPHPVNLTTLLTVHEAAAMLALSVATVRRLRLGGDLPAVRIGGSVRFHVSDVMALIEQRREQAVTPLGSAPTVGAASSEAA